MSIPINTQIFSESGVMVLQEYLPEAECQGPEEEKPNEEL